MLRRGRSHFFADAQRSWLYYPLLCSFDLIEVTVHQL